MSEIEKKIYPDWAFSEDQDLKRDMNLKIYEELESKYKISRSKENSENEEFDVVLSVTPAYNKNIVIVHRNEVDLSRTELALIADGGNLCFGFTRNGRIEVYTD